MEVHERQDAPVILTVEDDELVRTTQAIFLGDAGFNVIEVRTADAAWERLVDDMTVDLVVTDVNMPGQMNGDGLAEWIGAHRPALPVILTSALGRRHPLRDGHHFISKPYSLVELEMLIRKVLTRPGP